MPTAILLLNILTAEPEGRVMIVVLRAPSLAKFGEVDTVAVSENSFNIAKQYA